MSKIMERALEIERRDRQLLREVRKARAADPPRSLAWVGRKFGLTRARVSQIVKAANGGA